MNNVFTNADSADKKHYARCIQRLKEWRAPLSGWYCTAIIDVREDDPEAPLSSCELCDCCFVRYEHVMEHDLYFEPVTVGCICAGIMEDNVLKAQERERLMRNRSKRRRNFVRRTWKRNGDCLWYRQYRKKQLVIFKGSSGYSVSVGRTTVWKYKGRPILDFLSAMYAAFDLADPVEVIK